MTRLTALGIFLRGLTASGAQLAMKSGPPIANAAVLKTPQIAKNRPAGPSTYWELKAPGSFQYLNPIRSCCGLPPNTTMNVNSKNPMIRKTFRMEAQNSASPKYLTARQLRAKTTTKVHATQTPGLISGNQYDQRPVRAVQSAAVNILEEKCLDI